MIRKHSCQVVGPGDTFDQGPDKKAAVARGTNLRELILARPDQLVSTRHMFL